jgi:reverse gyrase
MTRDAGELLDLVKKIEGGGEWWKFIPKTIKSNAQFKPVYNILEQYRKCELSLQAQEANSSLGKEDNKSVESALNFVANALTNDKNVLG